jgi:hypothetical protein
MDPASRRNRNRGNVMKLFAADAAAILVAATSADAAPKKPRNVAPKRPVATVVYPNTVYAYDGEVLGADPDPFIRLLMIKEQKPRDWSD